jgi:hypothetical protein
MALPVIGYQTMLDDASVTITDPGTATGYSIANIHDFKSYTLWVSNTTTKPIFIDIDTGVSGQAADYIAFVNHNMSTLNGTHRVYADNGSPATTGLYTAQGFNEDGVTYWSFTSPGVVRYWRIQLSKATGNFASAPFVGQILLGLKTELPRYLAPSFEPYFDDVEIAGERSEGGHYLGGTARGHRHRGTITFGAGGYVRSGAALLHAFLDNHAALRKPFVFVVDPDASDGIGVAKYIKVTDNGRISRTAVGNTWLNLNLSLDVEEAFMESAT